MTTCLRRHVLVDSERVDEFQLNLVTAARRSLAQYEYQLIHK